MRNRFLAFLFVILFVVFPLTGCGLDGSQDTPRETTQDDTTKEQGSSNPLPTNSSFAVHFIDVGQADAALVICDDKTMLIDGGNVGDSDLIYSYLKKLNISYLDYVICTHPHEDHVGGLSGALSYATVGVAYSPVLTYTTKAFENFLDKVILQGKNLTVPTPGESFFLGSAKVTILGPLHTDYDETNDLSIVLRIEYGEVSFLFTGDMERKAESNLLEAGYDLRSTVIKVGHHGSETSSSYAFLREVSPTYGVISVGVDNDYGHPDEDVLSRYRDAEVKLYRTDLQGDIICTCEDGKTLRFTTAKNSDAITNPTEGNSSGSGNNGVTEYAYVGNLSSKKYHRTTCGSLPAEDNRIYFTTKEEAENAGYLPCGNCDP